MPKTWLLGPSRADRQLHPPSASCGARASRWAVASGAHIVVLKAGNVAQRAAECRQAATVITREADQVSLGAEEAGTAATSLDGRGKMTLVSRELLSRACRRVAYMLGHLQTGGHKKTLLGWPAPI